MAGYWPSADLDPALPAVMAEWATLSKEKPKVVFSRTLETVAWNSRLVQDDVRGEIVRLKAEAGGDLGIGGAGLTPRNVRR